LLIRIEQAPAHGWFLTGLDFRLDNTKLQTMAITIVAAKGGACTVELAVRPGGNCPAKSFLESECERLREGGKDQAASTARAKFLQLFQQMANYGSVSPTRFKKEMGKFFAFRHEVRNVQVRFPCFEDGDKWIVTHGFFKPGAKKGKGAWPTSEVQRAEEIRGEYLQQKQNAARSQKQQ
jgi:hypothetical protein